MFTHSLAHLSGIILLYNCPRIGWPESQSPTVWRLLSYCCRALRYANADSGKLVNWTTGTYGWLESRRSIYQTSNSAKQLYKTSKSSHCLTYVCFHAGWGTFRKWPEVGHVAFRHFPGSVYSKTLDNWEFPSSSTSIIRTTCMTFRLQQPHTWWASELYVALPEQSGEGQSPFRLILWLLNSNHLFH